MVMRRIFGLKREDVMTGWRTWRKKELQNLYSFKNILEFSNKERRGRRAM
jgi:hypothetical protein